MGATGEPLEGWSTHTPSANNGHGSMTNSGDVVVCVLFFPWRLSHKIVFLALSQELCWGAGRDFSIHV